jgi:hypothetical protein
MKRVGLCALAFCVGMSAVSALGATVTFDFRGSSLPTNNQWVDSTTGVSVTATPQSSIAKQTGYPFLTVDPNNGLGVSSFKYPVVGSDSPLINFGESIQFAFAPTIAVSSITFTELQGGLFGDYVFLSYSDGTTTQKLKAVHAQGSEPYDTYTYFLPTPVTATTFTVGSNCQLLNDFGIGGISVNYSGTSEPPVRDTNSVPLPAAIWEGLTLLSGLIGYRFWSRRRASAGA